MKLRAIMSEGRDDFHANAEAILHSNIHYFIKYVISTHKKYEIPVYVIVG